MSAQLKGCASPLWMAVLSETTAAIVPATVMKRERPMRMRHIATPVHHFRPRAAAERVRRVSQIHMTAGIVLEGVSRVSRVTAEETYTASGVPHRALMIVNRSSKTGIANEKMKTRIPVPTTHELPYQPLTSQSITRQLTARLSNAAMCLQSGVQCSEVPLQRHTWREYVCTRWLRRAIQVEQYRSRPASSTVQRILGRGYRCT